MELGGGHSEEPGRPVNRATQSLSNHARRESTK